MSEKAEIKTKIRDVVEGQREELIRLSLNIHDNPELGLQEVKAQKWLCDYLLQNKLQVERGVGGLATAFRAIYGEGRPRIALLAEYDALPQMGHGCGHNVIAAAAAGAGVASKIVVDDYGGSVAVLGSPAEEAFGGKIDMIGAGVFEDIDAVMMVHPDTQNVVAVSALACVSLDVKFWGKAAHAAASPEEGINALEALLLAFNAINSLRQHIRKDSRIHGIITEGGMVPNVVPAYSSARFMLRATDIDYLDTLRNKVLACFEGASLSSGARLQYGWGEKVYAPMKSNYSLACLFGNNLRLLGREIDDSSVKLNFGSTDMGNVSQIVPSIHPEVCIAPPEVSLHTPEFALAAASEEGHEGLLDAAKAMAMTVADILTQPEILKRIKQDFADEKQFAK